MFVHPKMERPYMYSVYLNPLNGQMVAHLIATVYDNETYNEIYLDESEEVDNMLEFIKNFRTIKLENKIGSNFEVSINKENNYDLIFKVLKITPEKQVKESSKKKLNIKYLDYDINLYYEIVLSEEDRALKAKQLESLKQSIERRKKLLANSSYVNKAPKELVEKERMTLKEEEEKLKLMEEN